MEENLYTSKQVLQRCIRASITKTKSPIWKTIMMGIMAGAFISFGAAASSVPLHGIENVGIARTVGGVVFPIGLMLIVFIGGELFTGNCLMITGILDKRYSIFAMLKNLAVVFLSNFIGAVFVALLIANSGQLGFSDGALGGYAIKTAVTKANLSFGTAFISGILCNILVCAAVFMATGAKDAAGKLWSIFFPIFVFVVCGFEHCVANLYYLCTGVLAVGNSSYTAKAVEKYGLTEEQLASLDLGNMFMNNVLPVTLGNVVGGVVFIGIPVYFLNKDKKASVSITPHKSQFTVIERISS